MLLDERPNTFIIEILIKRHGESRQLDFHAFPISTPIVITFRRKMFYKVTPYSLFDIRLYWTYYIVQNKKRSDKQKNLRKGEAFLLKSIWKS